MNIFKFSILGVFVMFSVFLSAQTFAADDIVAPKESVLVATVSIEDARIISQKGNTFGIAFSLTNKEILQTGVKYGIQLVPDGAKYIADEKVYNESLTLYENSSLKKEITYTAPSTFGGSYLLFLVSNNESGLPLGVVLLGKVKLTASIKGLNILNNSCYLQVEDEKGSPHYTLTQNVDINNNEALKITCTAINESNTTVSLTPFFETRYFNTYGKVAPQAGGDYTAITFTKGEGKTFSLSLPKGTSSDFYNLKLGLMDSTLSSNNISLNYIINGVNALIQKVSLDKDYYSRGEKGEMNILWSVLPSSFKRGGSASGSSASVMLEATIKNEKGIKCTSVVRQELTRDPENPETLIPFNIRGNCLNPKVSATLTDKKGNVLDQKEFSFKSDTQNVKPAKPSLVLILSLLVLLILIVFVSSVYKKKKKSVNI